MFSVYKITNLINQKCYIGSSNNVECRWQQHKNASIHEKNSSYNYPLQCAFRKYGLDNFNFKVLKDDFKTRFEAEEYEQEMIDYYNSYDKGYNQTRETHSALTDEKIRQESILKRSQKCAKIDKDNNILEIYASYQDAARKNNRPEEASHIRKVCKGELSYFLGCTFRDLDKEGNIVFVEQKRYKNRKPIIAIEINNPQNKIYFESILQASKELNIDRNSIQKCIRGENRYSVVGGFLFREIDSNGDIIENNILIDEKIQEYNKKNPIINGQRNSIKKWCEIYGISTSSYYARRKKGMSVIEAITKRKVR